MEEMLNLINYERVRRGLRDNPADILQRSGRSRCRIAYHRNNTAYMADGKEIPVSRLRSTEFSKVILQYIRYSI